MKRWTACLLLCLLLVGCSADTAEPDPAQLGSDLLAAGGFPESMVELDADMMEAVYRMDMGTVEDFFASVSGGATADEVLVLIAADEDAAGNLEELLADHVSYRLDSFSTYLPAEAEKLRHAILTREGRTVILCVCGDYEAAQAVLDER